MSSSLEDFSSPSPPKNSVETPSPAHSYLRAPSQTEKLERRGVCARRGHYSIHIHPVGKSISGTLGQHPVPRPGPGRAEQKHVSTQLVQPVQPSQLFHGVLPSRNQVSNLLGGLEEKCTFDTKETARRLWKKQTTVVHNPCHSRAPMAPCLSFPVMILSSISRLSSGDATKLLPKFQRPNFLQNKSTSNVKASPAIQKVVHKYRGLCHRDDKELLTAFLKNNGDHSDCEVDEDEDQSTNLANPLKATLESLKMIPRALELPHPTRSSSIGSSSSSSSNDSIQMPSLASQTAASVTSSNYSSCNRGKHLTDRNKSGSRLDFLAL